MKNRGVQKNYAVNYKRLKQKKQHFLFFFKKKTMKLTKLDPKRREN